MLAYRYVIGLVMLLIGCTGGTPNRGPALPPRPATQTCLADFSGTMPARLSETGCFTDLAALEPAPELISYDVNSPLWTDGAYKPRFIVVPYEESIRIENDGTWSFPEGTILIKVFGFEFDVGRSESRRPVETRFMVRTADAWIFSTYQWNEDGTDADLLNSGTSAEYTIENAGETQEITYRYPSLFDCTSCHSDDSTQVLGVKTSQMNRLHDYAGTIENQLVAMNDIGLFEGNPDLDPPTLPALQTPLGTSGSDEEKARAYLDANCAHCHHPGGFASNSVELDLRYGVRLESTGLCEPMELFRWAGAPRLLAGDAAASGMYQRLVTTDEFRMPSVGTSVTDAEGIEVIRTWIDGLENCPTP